MNLWGGRFQKKISDDMKKINCSLPFDIRLYPYDIKGSIAHVEMLAKQNIIKQNEKELLINGLKNVKKDIKNELENNEFNYFESEDVHTLIEKRLSKKIGKTAGKLHTARSRNDQVALDIKLYLRDKTILTNQLLIKLMKEVLKLAEKHLDTIMPGYTHLQKAQPITFGHHMLAYYYKFKRDQKKFVSSLDNLNLCPLGSGALAGSGFNIDRKWVAKKLGFKKIYDNTIDAVSDRDFILEYIFNVSNLMVHLSSLSEEIIIWNTDEFSYITLDDMYSTGSSIMPQKKNPDLAELTRGKSGRIFGNLIQSLTMLKGLPLAYNKDLQEDKEGLFDTVDTITKILRVYPKMLNTIKINKDKMEKAVKKGFMNATELADYFTQKGLPFRKAHEIVGEIIIYAEKNNKELNQLSIEEYKKITREYKYLIDENLFKVLNNSYSIQNKKVLGSPSYKFVKMNISKEQKYLKSNSKTEYKK